MRDLLTSLFKPRALGMIHIINDFWRLYVGVMFKQKETVHRFDKMYVVPYNPVVNIYPKVNKGEQNLVCTAVFISVVG